jgi:hypothetical protein
MDRSSGPWRAVAGFALLALLVVVVALPALAADPSGSPVTPSVSPSVAPGTIEPAGSPSATAEPLAEPEASDEDEPEASDEAKPENEAKPEKPDKAKDDDDEDEADVTVTGTVAAKADADGEPGYTLTTGSTVRTLDVGPPWYWGDHNPLAAYVGKTVTVVGEQKTGSDELEVRSVDGKVIREPGKPPWAGGWKVVGKIHPGWSQEKADRWAAKQAAKAKSKGVDCWPPGHCRDAASTTAGGAGGH